MEESSESRVIQKVVAFAVGAVVFAWCSGQTSNEFRYSTDEIMEYGLDSTRAAVLARTMNQHIDTLLTMPRFQTIMDTAESDEAGYRAAAQVSWSGILTLPTATLDSALTYTRQLLDVATEEECGLLAQGELDMSGELRLYGRLDTISLKHMVSINVRGSLASMSGQNNKLSISEEDEDEAWNALANAAPSDSLDKFIGLIDKEKSLTDSEWCWLGNFLFKTVQQMDPKYRRIFLEFIAQQS